MGQEHNSKKHRGWKQLSERERYKIEALDREGLKAKEIARHLERDRRTIERELLRGRVVQRRENPYASRNPKAPDYLEEKRYYADVGQRVREERAANKGRSLKIGCGHDLAQYIEKKIGKEKYSPDAVIGGIREKGLKFSTMICTKTLYNYIDQGLFLSITNKDLPVKKHAKKRDYRPVRKENSLRPISSAWSLGSTVTLAESSLTVRHLSFCFLLNFSSCFLGRVLGNLTCNLQNIISIFILPLDKLI